MEVAAGGEDGIRPGVDSVGGDGEFGGRGSWDRGVVAAEGECSQDGLAVCSPAILSISR